MPTRKLSLQARTLKALSKHPGVIKSLPSPLRVKGENDLATQLQRKYRSKQRYRSTKDQYYGKPDDLTKKAIIRHILDSGSSNLDIMGILLDKFNEQSELLNILSRPALDEIYNNVSRHQIANQALRDRANSDEYGHLASPRGGFKKSKKSKKSKN